MLTLPVSVASRGAVINSGMPAATIGNDVNRRRYGRKARADAQRRTARKDGGARFAQRAGNDEGMAKGAFVGVAPAHHGQIPEFAGLEPMQFQIRIVVEQLRRRADLANDQLADTVSARRNHLAQLGGRQA